MINRVSGADRRTTPTTNSGTEGKGARAEGIHAISTRLSLPDESRENRNTMCNLVQMHPDFHPAAILSFSKFTCGFCGFHMTGARESMAKHFRTGECVFLLLNFADKQAWIKGNCLLEDCEARKFGGKEDFVFSALIDHLYEFHAEQSFKCPYCRILVEFRYFRIHIFCHAALSFVQQVITCKKCPEIEAFESSKEFLAHAHSHFPKANTLNANHFTRCLSDKLEKPWKNVVLFEVLLQNRLKKAQISRSHTTE